VTESDRSSPHRRGPLFWISAAAGWALIFWGLRGIFHHHVDTRPSELARFFVAGALLHDLVFAPLVLVGGVAVARLAPSRWRAYVQAGLIISGGLALFAYPEVRDYARVRHNPTSLPFNYSANLAVAIGIVWAAIGVLAVARARLTSEGRPRARPNHRRRGSRGPP
jgi:hypothetical protein